VIPHFQAEPGTRHVVARPHGTPALTGHGIRAEAIRVDAANYNIPGYPTLETTFSVSAGQTATLEKIVTVFTSAGES